MPKIQVTDLTDCISRPDSSVVVLDKHLLSLFDQLVALGLAESWEVKINGPIDHEYTSTKLMQKLAKRVPVLKNRGSIGS
jgi:hypothetical protein